MRSLALLALPVGFLLFGAPPPAPPRWIRANFHAHTVSDRLHDDGTESPAALHRVARERGLDFSLHSPHSSKNRSLGDDAADAALGEQRAAEARLAVPGLTIAVGEELTVRDGPRYQRHMQFLGQDTPGNLNHLTVFGQRGFVPSETELGAACDRVHRDGGVCIVNHPGPGPLMWEEGLWEAPDKRGKIDALEVYNGQGLAMVGLDFEARYREATAYSGLGLHIAAVAGADTHGPNAVEHGRRRLLGTGNAAKLLGFLAPQASGPRPEFDAVTLLLAKSASEADVLAALRARRSVATYGLRELDVELLDLGQVKKSADVQLRLALSRPVATITLYREGAPVRTWQDAREARWREHITSPAAYVFSVRDGVGRLLTSAIWYEP